MSPEVKRQRLIESYIRRGVKRSQAYYDFLAIQPVIIRGPRNYRYYPCAHCHEYFVRRNLNLDHIEPVVEPQSGFTDWNSYVERAYCGPEGFQHLCLPCHKAKSKTEGQLRTKARQAKKVKPSP